MKLLLLLALVLPSMDITPAAIAKLCGNVVVHDSEKEKVIGVTKSQGCSEVRMVELEDGYYLIYGVKVLRGESKGDTVSAALDDQ